MKRALVLALLVAGCGGKDGTLSLDIVVSPVDDPFADATQVRFIVGDQSHVKVFPVSAGHFDVSIGQSPEASPGPVIVDALDAAGNIVGHGQTPVLQLQAVNQGPVAVWVGRPGHVAAAATKLSKPLVEMASVAVPGLGILYAGGRSSDGMPTSSTMTYDVFTHAIIDTATMQTARAGAAGMVVENIQVAISCGDGGPGFGGSTMPLASTEVFDPTVGNGLWSPAASDPIAPRARPDLTVLGSGVGLLSGGLDASPAPLASGALVTPTGTVRVSAIAGTMAARRAGHAVAPAHFADGSDGALLVGGLQPGSTEPVAERLVGQAFSAYDVPGLTNRVGARAVALSSGSILVIGGAADGAAATASGVLIGVGNNPPTLMPLPNLLSVARVGHTVTAVGSDLLVCGGADATGAVQASCDLLDGSTLAIKKTVMMAAARRDHSALALETGPVVIAGGTGSDGAPLDSIEIYTP